MTSKPTRVRALTEKERAELFTFVVIQPAERTFAGPVARRLEDMGLLARHEGVGWIYATELGDRVASEQGIR